MYCNENYLKYWNAIEKSNIIDWLVSFFFIFLQFILDFCFLKIIFCYLFVVKILFSLLGCLSASYSTRFAICDTYHFKFGFRGKKMVKLAWHYYLEPQADNASGCFTGCLWNASYFRSNTCFYCSLNFK